MPNPRMCKVALGQNWIYTMCKKAKGLRSRKSAYRFWRKCFSFFVTANICPRWRCGQQRAPPMAVQPAAHCRWAHTDTICWTIWGKLLKSNLLFFENHKAPILWMRKAQNQIMITVCFCTVPRERCALPAPPRRPPKPRTRSHLNALWDSKARARLNSEGTEIFIWQQ